MTNHAEPQPRLSVILPVRNEEAHIRRVLDELLDQSLEREAYELLVVDGMSDDRTREIVLDAARVHGNVRLLDNPALRSGPARNVGAAAARAPYVFFVDGHCYVRSRTLLENVLASFEEGALCISRPQPLTPSPGHAFQEAVALARRSPLGHYAGSEIFRRHTVWCSPLSAGCGYEKSLYEDLGGVDESFDAAEDLEFNLRVDRLGVRAKHCTDFAVGYVPRGDWTSLFRQLYRYGYGRARMARKHRGAFSPPVLSLALFILALCVLPPLALVAPAAGRLWLWMAGGYAALTALSALWGARSRPSLTPLVASALAAVHFGGGLGYLSGLLRGPSGFHAQPAAGPRER